MKLKCSDDTIIMTSYYTIAESKYKIMLQPKNITKDSISKPCTPNPKMT